MIKPFQVVSVTANVSMQTYLSCEAVGLQTTVTLNRQSCAETILITVKSETSVQAQPGTDFISSMCA